MAPKAEVSGKDNMDALDLTIEALQKRADRHEEAFGLGATEGAQTLISRHFDTYLEIFTTKIEAVRGTNFRGTKRQLLDLDLELLTLTALYSGISAVGTISDFSHRLRYIGRAFENECYGFAFRSFNEKMAEQTEAIVKRDNWSLKTRKKALEALAKRLEFNHPEWTDNDRTNTAMWVVEGLIAGPLFTLLDGPMDIALTVEALAEVEEILADLVLRNPLTRVQVEKPPHWEWFINHIEGVPYQLIRTWQKEAKRHVERHIRSGGMEPTFTAINHAQDVPWRINEDMLELVRECYERELGIPGLPRKTPLPTPIKDKPWEDMTEDEQRVWKRRSFEVRTANRGFVGERIVLARDLAEADALRGKTFWTPMNVDWRGRVYGMPHFNFQRADPIRCLFEFKQGQVLTEEGLYWLKVHLANCGDFGKVSKKPFDERVQWVDDNDVWLTKVAWNPLEHVDKWIGADKPFMFVAACKALMDAQWNLPVHLPVSFDGSCSGLQHLCAMTRAPEGSLVNLTPSEQPQDVYQVVADRLKERIEADLGGEYDTIARQCLAYGVGRSLVKRNVMTYSYSSKIGGMKDQHLEDTMSVLDFKVLTGELKEHPFGDTAFHAAFYLARHTYAAIEEVVNKPAEAMRFLQTLARTCAHEGKPVVWTTPVGFPVMLRYPNIVTRNIRLFLHDKGIKRRFSPKTGDEAPGINKSDAAKSIAPSFVHSMDACHLMMVLLACKKQGIDSIALVHDSFGCLPNDASRLRHILKDTFRKLYTENDVLENIRKETLDQLQTTGYKIPAVPAKGTLDLDKIMMAEYCFA